MRWGSGRSLWHAQWVRWLVAAAVLLLYTLLLVRVMRSPAGVPPPAPAPAPAPAPRATQQLLEGSLQRQRELSIELDALRVTHANAMQRITAIDAQLTTLHTAASAAIKATPLTAPTSPAPTVAPPPPPAPAPGAVAAPVPVPPSIGVGVGVGVGVSVSGARRHLILSLCENPARYMTIFLGSLRRTGSTAEVVCFHFQKPIDAHVQATYDAFGPVTVAPFTVPQGFHPVHYRMTAYVEWFRAQRAAGTIDRYEKVLLVDSLDMAFQTDPFAIFTHNELLLSQETLKTNHTVCKANRDWVIECFGQSEYASMATAPVLNSGFIAGSLPTIEWLVARISKEVSRSHKCADQAVLNWLYHTHHLTPQSALPLPASVAVRVVTVESGSVLHTLESVCSEAAHEKGRDVFGRLMNLQRTAVVAVVHQWTRCQGLISHFFAQYPYTGPWKFPGAF